jgi:hypothetical protein
MPLWDSADLLQRCKDKTKIPQPSEEMDDPAWYRLLTEAQTFWMKKMSATKPEPNYGPPVKMVTADGGLTYTFGAADADGRFPFPLGHAEIRESRNGRLWIPSTDWQQRDFVMEGDRIRIPNGRQRTVGDGPYARFVADPSTPIDANTQPVLKPYSARILLVNRANILWALQGGKRDPAPYEAEENSNWDAIVEALATQFFMSGAQAVDEDGDMGFAGYGGDNPADYVRHG